MLLLYVAFCPMLVSVTSLPSMSSSTQSTSHTPAPWLLDGTIIHVIEKGADRFAAYVTSPNKIASQQEVDANAHLIAAAPELVEACWEAFECLVILQDKTGTLTEVEEDCKKTLLAAITQATSHPAK